MENLPAMTAGAIRAEYRRVCGHSAPVAEVARRLGIGQDAVREALDVGGQGGDAKPVTQVIETLESAATEAQRLLAEMSAEAERLRPARRDGGTWITAGYGAACRERDRMAIVADTWANAVTAARSVTEGMPSDG